MAIIADRAIDEALGAEDTLGDLMLDLFCWLPVMIQRFWRASIARCSRAQAPLA
jgi:hypothetical protein